MRRIYFGWIALIAGACAGTRDAEFDTFAGEDVGGSASPGGTTATESPPKGGSQHGDTSTQSGRDQGHSAGEAGSFEPGAGGGAAGAGGGDGSDTCDTPTSLPFLGDYTEPNGDELWLRDSGKAVTLVRLQAGKPASAKPPALWQVVQSCSAESALLLKSVAGLFTRLDYIRGATSLTVCISMASSDSVEQAHALTAADRTNTIDSGCNDGSWTRFRKEGK